MKNRLNLIGMVAFLAGITIFAVSFFKKPPEEQKDLSKNTNFKSQETKASTTQIHRAETSEPLTLAEEEIPSEDPPGYYYELESRPFEVTQSTGNFEWTAADGKSPEVMRILATNPSNLGQLTDQNEWTDKRQLVYLTENFKRQADKVFEGKVKSIAIPGFDGEELEVSVNTVGSVESGETFFFEGTLKDNPNVYVDAARTDGIWAISYTKPGDKFLYDYISRQDGELIINRLDADAQALAIHDHHHDHNDPNCSLCSPFHTDEVGSIGN